MWKTLKIYLERSGGFIGVHKTFIVNFDSLSFDEQNILRNMINKAKFFDLPSEAPLPKRGADYFKYRLTIEENEKSHTIKTNDVIMPSDLRPLVNYIITKGKV